MKRHAHRSEHTGDAGQNRQQDNVRALTSYTQRLLEAVARTHGIGLRRVRMQDKAYRLGPADLEGAFIVITGPLTSARDIVVPRATDAGAFGRWFYNFTGQDLTFRNPDGSTQITAADVTGLIVVSADGPEVWT